MFASAYRRLTTDQLVTSSPCLITGYSLNVSTDGGSVAIYDGHDTSSGWPVDTIEGLANVNNHAQFDFPVMLNNGLYVDVGSNVTSFTIYYIPLRGNSPLQAYPGFMMSESVQSDG